MDNCFYLDLNRVTLFGWESKKSIESVEAIANGIRGGDKFPPVPVYQMDQNTYSLARAHTIRVYSPLFAFFSDGGHTRSVAHYIENTPLFVKLLAHRPSINPGQLDPFGTINIKDIMLISNPTEYFFKSRLFPNYRGY